MIETLMEEVSFVFKEIYEYECRAGSKKSDLFRLLGFPLKKKEKIVFNRNCFKLWKIWVDILMRDLKHVGTAETGFEPREDSILQTQFGIMWPSTLRIKKWEKHFFNQLFLDKFQTFECDLDEWY